MPHLASLAAEGVLFSFRPEPLGLTRQRLLAPIHAACERLSCFQWATESRASRAGLLTDYVPRRAAFRPFRRWIGRRWQRLPLEVDPAFVPSASLGFLELVPAINPDENLLSDLDERDVSGLASPVDYPWLPQTESGLTWVDAVHERDYAAWGRAAIGSANDLVYLDLGHSLSRTIFRWSESSAPVRRGLRRLDRQLARVLRPRTRPGARRIMLVSPEAAAPVVARIGIEERLDRDHFVPGRHYVAVIHPTYAQFWCLSSRDRDLLEGSIARVGTVTLVHPQDIVRHLSQGNHRWGDFLAIPERGHIFHPNHFDGRTPRRTAAGWAGTPSPQHAGFALLCGSDWPLPRDPPEKVDAGFLRRVVLDALLTDT